MKVLILGSTGMLGNAVLKEFEGRADYDVTATRRTNALSIELSNTATEGYKLVDFDTKEGPFPRERFDYIINCIGVIKPFIDKDVATSIHTNSVFPHMLSTWAGYNGMKLIHITTDCVFSGSKGAYTEEDEHDMIDLYGRSKSLGETKEAMVLRTSIIGEEIHKHASLISWVKSQKGKTVNGFTNHMWNGVTTNQYAKICKKIIEEDLYKENLFHVFSPTSVNKNDLVELINKKFNLDITVEETEAEEAVDRTLSTVKNLNKQLSIPEIEDQINNL